MSATYVRFTGTNPAMTLTLGRLQYVHPHCGQDHELCAEIRFDHGLMLMPSAALRELVRQSQEALTAQSAKASRRPA